MGKISFLTEYGHIIYQIEGIDEAIALWLFSSKSEDYVIQDGHKKVKSSFFELLLQTSSPKTLIQ